MGLLIGITAQGQWSSIICIHGTVVGHCGPEPAADFPLVKDVRCNGAGWREFRSVDNQNVAKN